MTLTYSELLPLRSDEDLVLMRHAVRERLKVGGFNLVDQTKMVTAASELGRNILDYGGGGSVRVETLERGQRTGVRLVFEDQGPGIEDIERALTDGFSTGGGLGLGLGGSRRLVNEFEIHSAPGQGTRVTVVRWT